MDDDLIDDKVKKQLVHKAVNYQSQYRLTATIGQGCDRHLVALLFASRELGMDLPKIFAEKVSTHDIKKRTVHWNFEQETYIIIIY